jgi:CRP-like cAMP-binding protein
MLRKGQMFGEAQFITQSNMDYSAKTASITVLATIDRSEFESLIRDFPFDMEVNIITK